MLCLETFVTIRGLHLALARDMNKHPTMYKTASAPKNRPAPNVSSARVGQPEAEAEAASEYQGHPARWLFVRTPTNEMPQQRTVRSKMSEG